MFRWVGRSIRSRFERLGWRKAVGVLAFPILSAAFGSRTASAVLLGGPRRRRLISAFRIVKFLSKKWVSSGSRTVFVRSATFNWSLPIKSIVGVDFDDVTLAKEGPWIGITLKPGRPAPLPSRNTSGHGAKQVRHRISVVYFSMAIGRWYSAYAGCRTLKLRLGSGALSSPYAIHRGGCDE